MVDVHREAIAYAISEVLDIENIVKAEMIVTGDMSRHPMINPAEVSGGWGVGVVLDAEVWQFPSGGSSGSTAEIKIKIGGAWKDVGEIDVSGWSD